LARRTFDVTDVTEIFIHWYAGRSQSEIENTNLRRTSDSSSA